MTGQFKYEAVGEHMREVLSSSVFTPDDPPTGDCDALIVHFETAAVRVTINGETDPTSTVGFPYAVGDSDILPYSQGKMPRFLGNGAVLQLQWARIIKGF